MLVPALLLSLAANAWLMRSPAREWWRTTTTAIRDDERLACEVLHVPEADFATLDFGETRVETLALR